MSKQLLIINKSRLVPSTEFLGIQLDDKLNFSLHISNICKSAANQLIAWITLQKCLSFKDKKILINSYFMANFNYCSRVQMFASAVFLKENRKSSETNSEVFIQKLQHTI